MKLGPVALSLTWLQFLHGAHSAAFVKHKLKRGKVIEEDTSDNEDDEEMRREQLLAERDDLKAQLATKNREFLEQHRKADRLLHQLRRQRQEEKAEVVQLARVRTALAHLSSEAAADAAENGVGGSADANASSTEELEMPVTLPSNVASPSPTPRLHQRQRGAAASRQGLPLAGKRTSSVASSASAGEKHKPSAAAVVRSMQQITEEYVGGPSESVGSGNAGVGAVEGAAHPESPSAMAAFGPTTPAVKTETLSDAEVATGASKKVDVSTIASLSESVTPAADDFDDAVKDAQAAPQQERQERLEEQGEEHRQMAFAQEGLQAAQGRQAALVGQIAQLRSQRESLQKQVQAAKTRKMEQLAKDKRELHEMALNADSKVHAIEKNVQNMQAELQRVRKAEAAAAAEGTKAKDTLMQETDQALLASQRAESLSTQLAEVRKASEQSGRRVSELASQASALRTESDQAAAITRKLTEQINGWRARAEALQVSFEKANVQANTNAKEAEALHEHILELSEESQRADSLVHQLRVLRTAALANMSREAALKQQMQRERKLKDYYSSKYEAMQNQSDTWQAKADDLDHRLLKSEREETAVARQRDSAMDRVRQARSEADEYSEENNMLKQQDQELEAQLRERSLAANATEDEVQARTVEVRQLRSEAAREKAASHAAWVSNERELTQAKQNLNAINLLKEQQEDKLMRIQAVLTATQRKKLGLPPAPHLAKRKRANQQVWGSAAAMASTAKFASPRHPGAQSGGKALVPISGISLVVAVKPAILKPTVALPKQPHSSQLLRGEPRRPADSNEAADATLLSVVAPKAATPSSARSALQKLAAYFASPLQH